MTIKQEARAKFAQLFFLGGGGDGGGGEWGGRGGRSELWMSSRSMRLLENVAIQWLATVRILL